jgi:hypothetical protein
MSKKTYKPCTCLPNIESVPDGYFMISYAESEMNHQQ